WRSRTPCGARPRLPSDSDPSGGSFVDHSLALAANPDLAAVLEHAVPDARGRAALGADQLHVRSVQRGFLLEDAALDATLRVRPRMALDEIDALDDEAVLVGDHAQHAALLAAILARDHLHA